MGIGVGLMKNALQQQALFLPIDTIAFGVS
jgi:hypothetical protein